MTTKSSKMIIVIGITIPFIMYSFVFGIKDSLYLFPLWAVSIIYLIWAYYFIKAFNERFNNL